MRTLQVQIITSVEFYKHGDRNFIQCVPYGTTYFIDIEDITLNTLTTVITLLDYYKFTIVAF